MSLPEIMTIEEVAEHLRVSERTVYDWAQKSEIPWVNLEHPGGSNGRTLKNG